MVVGSEAVLRAFSSIAERAAPVSGHLPPRAHRLHGNTSEILFCVCVSSERAKVQTGYWLIKGSRRYLTFHTGMYDTGGCSAAQVWLWMSAGGALILLPSGEVSLGGHDPCVVPHCEILRLLAV